MDLGAPELILILVIVVLLFGVGRIGKIAGELGSGIRAFREGLQSDGSESKIEKESTPIQETHINPPEEEAVTTENRT